MVFWTCFIGLSALLMVRMLRATIEKGDFSTSINLDTSYRDWVNSFPAVSICLSKGRTTVPLKAALGNTLYFVNGSTMQIQMRHFRVMQALLFVDYQKPTEGISLDACLEMNDTCGMDLNVQRNILLPTTCHRVMSKLTYLGEELNCSNIFIPYETELGRCFVANSLYTKNFTTGTVNLENFDSLPLKFSNHDHRDRALEFHYIDNPFLQYKLMIHTPEELPNGKLDNIVLGKAGGMKKMLLKITEFHNNNDVK